MATGNFELHQLRCFVAVAHELNFRRAADHLNMTQPPLSRQIKLLEHCLGFALFERNNRNVRLTPGGRSLLASALDILQRSEHAVMKARQASQGVAGEIKMGFVPSSAFSFLPPITAIMRAHLPNVEFRPTEMMSYETIEALRSRTIDFGLTRSSGLGADIESIQVVSETFLAALPLNHPLAQRALLRMEDLHEQNFIGYSADRGGQLRTVHRGLFAYTHVEPNVVLEVSQTQTLLAMVNEGLGIGLVPTSSCVQRMENLTYRTIDIPENFRSDLYLCSTTDSNSALHAAVKTLILDLLNKKVQTDNSRPEAIGDAAES